MTTGPQIESVQRIRPILGILGVLLGASLATFFGRLLSVGAPDLRGALRLDVDSSSWIGTTYNMGMMFIGPFSVYLGGFFGPRRVLLAAATLFTALCIVMPFAGHLPALLFLLAAAGMTAGTFYPLTLSFILRNLPQSYLHLGIAAYAVDIVVTTHMAHSYEGWVMNTLSWHWIFWTTALITPVMMALVVFGISPTADAEAPAWRTFTKLARLPILQPRSSPALRSDGSRTTTRLVAFGHLCRYGRIWFLPYFGSSCPALQQAKSPDQFPLSSA